MLNDGISSSLWRGPARVYEHEAVLMPYSILSSDRYKKTGADGKFSSAPVFYFVQLLEAVFSPSVHIDRLHLAFTRNGDGEGVACCVLLHQGAKVVLGGDLGAVHAHDAVTGLQACLFGRAALDHLHNVNAVGIHAQLRSSLCVGHGQLR